MAISKLLLKTSYATLDAILKASDADIRLHGEENIPNQPVLYVVNHFTRIETTFLPSMIKKCTGKYTLSLAYHSFFEGTFGKILEKLGAISTKDPDRKKILTNALLTGDMSIIIFPEGQMLKDKKLIEKGKYLVYNSGIRRPPHTGAARLALRTQFYREKIRYFHEIGFIEGIEKYKEHFSLSDDDIYNIRRRNTEIVPVNITYYPVRAKNNAILRLVEKFTKDVSPRMEEELEVEGTMLLEGVDIDINFGKPISVKKFLERSSNARNRMHDNKLYLDKEVRRKELPLPKVSIDLMYAYMDSIYAMTTVNHDHLYACLLSMYRGNSIEETDFKNRANLAIESIKKLNLTNFHSTLSKKQYNLRTDDFNDKYDSFIEAAVSDNLITVKDGYIYKHKEKFNNAYAFHDVRQNNIVEVLKNEVEPLTHLLKTVRRLSMLPGSVIRRMTRKKFIELDMKLFNRDYKKYYIEGETKPENIGSPFFLKDSFSLKRFNKRKGVILVHGYMAAPEEMRLLAENLHKEGYVVYGARLRGHGTAPEDLGHRNWYEWYNSVNRAYVVMKNSVKDFAIIGFSTGAGLSLLQAANKGNKLKGVVSINAPLRLQNISSRLSSAVVVWNKFIKKVRLEKGAMEFVKNDPENPHINYFRNPISGVNELGKLMNVVEGRLEEVKIPCLVVQGSNDPVVNPTSGLDIFEKLGSKDKELYRIYSDRHGIVRGEELKKVTSKILQFLNEVFKK
ncbi:MAG: hypothetical protein GY754_21295 [bacterium]|nr:hypothetical protein [bacterium]